MNSDVGGTLKYIITGDADQLLQTLDKVRKATDDLAGDVGTSSAKAGSALKDKVGDGASEASRQFRKFVDDSVAGLAEVTSAIGKISFDAFTTAAGMASTAMAGMVSKGINIGSSLEKNRLSFEALTGSVQGAEKVLTSVADFASENPYQLLDVSNVARELVAMGRSADQVEGDLAKLGAIGVATGADLQGLGHVYGQISAQGKMMTQDMYQLVNQGVAIMPALAKVTGKSMTELKDYISDGKITMEVFEEALTQVVDPAMYDNLLNKMNNTIPRQLDRLKGSISTFATSLVGIDKWTGQKLETGLAQTYTDILRKLANNLRNSELIKAVQKFGQKLAEAINKFVPLLDKIAPVLTKIFNTLSDNMGMMLPIVGGALVMFGKLGSSLPVIGPLFNSVGGGVSNLVSRLKGLYSVNPILGVLVTMLGIGLPKALSNPQMKSALSSIFNSLGRIAKALTPVISQIAELMATVGSNILVALLSAIAPILEVIANVLNAIPTPVLTALVEGIIGLLVVKKVTGPLKTFGTALGTAFKYFKAGGTISSAISIFKDLTGFGKAASTAAKTATGTMESVSKIGQATTQASQSLTKGQQLMKTIRSGIVNLILLAGAIAALAGALWVAQKLIPDDLGSLIPKLGVMAGVVAVMGTFAFAAGKIESINWKSIALLIGLAADLAAFAAAIWAVNTLIPDEMGNLAIKLGMLGGVIAAMEILAGLAGKFAGNETKGLLLIAGMAADIVILALALKVVDNSIPDNFGEFALKLANLGIAVAGMGVLAGIIGNFPFQEALGLVLIAGIAGDLALLGLALGVVDQSIQSDFGTMVGKLGAMGLAITEIGVIAGIIGAIMATGIGALILGAGLAGIVAICGAIMVVAEAIAQIDQKVPANIEVVTNKLEGMKKAIEVMSDAAFGNVLKNFIGMINIAEIAVIANIYAAIGDILNYIQAIPLDLGAIQEKIGIIKECINLVSATDEDSVGGLFKSIVKDFLNLVDVDLARRTLEIYQYIGNTLNEIQNIPISAEGVKEKVELIKGIIDYVAATDDKSVGQAIAHTCRQFLDTINTENVAKVIDIYKGVADNLKHIQEIELNTETIRSQVEKIKEIIELVSATDDQSFFGLLIQGAKNAANANAQENAGRILKVYSEVCDAVKKIEETIPKDAGDLIQKVKNIRDVVYEASQVNETGGIENKEKIVGITQSIINKFSEMAGTINNIPNVDSKVLENIKTIRDCIYEAGSINERKGNENQEQIVGRTQSIINKFSEIAKTVNELPALGENVMTNIKNIRDAVYEAGSINQNAGNENQENIVGRSQSIINKFKEIAETLNQIPGLDPQVETNIVNIRNCVYAAGQINQNSASENQQAIVARSQSIINKFKEIAETLNNIPGLNPATETNISNIRNCIYMVGQINEVSGLEYKETIVSISQSILHKFKEFAEVANQIPGLVPETEINIENIKRCIGLIAGLSVGENMDGKLDTANKAVAILRHLVEFSTVASTIVQTEQGVFDTISRICQIINDSITKLVSDLNAQLPNFITIGSDMAGNLLDGWDSMNVSGFFDMQTAKILSKMDEFARSMENKGGSVGSAFLKGLGDKDIPGAAENIGTQTGIGFARGIENTVWRINSAMGELSSAAISKLKTLLGIASPSKVFFKLGEYTGQGLAQGLTSQVEEVRDAAEEIADAIRTPFEGLDEITASITGSTGSGTYGGTSHSTTINQNNIINNGTDYSTMMADLKWALFTA